MRKAAIRKPVSLGSHGQQHDYYLLRGGLLASMGTGTGFLGAGYGDVEYDGVVDRAHHAGAVDGDGGVRKGLAKTSLISFLFRLEAEDRVFRYCT